MTVPIEEFELTALIDGELDERRAAEVRAAVSRDPALRAKLEAMRSADSAWIAAAATALFRPAVHLPSHPRTSDPFFLVPILFAVCLAAARMAAKLVDPGFAAAMLLHGVMLAAALAFVFLWITRIPPRPSPAPAHT